MTPHLTEKEMLRQRLREKIRLQRLGRLSRPLKEKEVESIIRSKTKVFPAPSDGDPGNGGNIKDPVTGKFRARMQ